MSKRGVGESRKRWRLWTGGLCGVSRLEATGAPCRAAQRGSTQCHKLPVLLTQPGGRQRLSDVSVVAQGAASG